MQTLEVVHGLQGMRRVSKAKTHAGIITYLLKPNVLSLEDATLPLTASSMAAAIGPFTVRSFAARSQSPKAQGSKLPPVKPARAPTSMDCLLATTTTQASHHARILLRLTNVGQIICHSTRMLGRKCVDKRTNQKD